MNIAALKKTVDEQRRSGLAVRGLVFINPGNPTGQPSSLQIAACWQSSPFSQSCNESPWFQGS